MTTLNDILNTQSYIKNATGVGTKMHVLLQHIVIDGDIVHGNQDIIQKIKSNPELVRFFTPKSRTEVPIAGTVNGRFVSRRIDRLNIDDENRVIDILDYKTDVNPDAFYLSYVAQISEYAQLLRATYPAYTINCYILWTHDFSLEKIVCKQV